MQDRWSQAYNTSGRMSQQRMLYVVLYQKRYVNRVEEFIEFHMEP